VNQNAPANPTPGAPAPPDELVQRWSEEYRHLPYSDEFPPDSYYNYVARQSAAWGADEQLNRCMGWLMQRPVNVAPGLAKHMLAAMRPKPPGLAQAMQERQELAGLLIELAGSLSNYARIFRIMHPPHCADVLSEKARAAAERLSTPTQENRS
jgi:hypothetical protein